MTSPSVAKEDCQADQGYEHSVVNHAAGPPSRDEADTPGADSGDQGQRSAQLALVQDLEQAKDSLRAVNIQISYEAISTENETQFLQSLIAKFAAEYERGLAEYEARKKAYRVEYDKRMKAFLAEVDGRMEVLEGNRVAREQAKAGALEKVIACGVALEEVGSATSSVRRV